VLRQRRVLSLSGDVNGAEGDRRARGPRSAWPRRDRPDRRPRRA